MTICVYCSSSDRIDGRYARAAEALGRLLAARGHALVYGGGSVGLMGAVARAVHAGGGRVCGVIPEALQAKEGVAYDAADELVVTKTMAERKTEMYRRADAFVALPGGFGTLEEFLEILTLRQLGYHRRPLALVNTGGFYDTLLGFFGELHAGGFAHRPRADLYRVARTPEEALDHIAAHEGAPSERPLQ